MTDFETHPIGTADLVKRLRSNTPNMVIGHASMHEAADRIERLEAALTRANAATAAAYEVAAQKCDYIIKNIEILKPDGETYETPRVQKVARGLVDLARQDIRALATPDQTAALDRLIAEAEARVWKEAEKLVRPTRGKSGNGIVVAALHRVADALLEASKKGDA